MACFWDWLINLIRVIDGVRGYLWHGIVLYCMMWHETYLPMARPLLVLCLGGGRVVAVPWIGRKSVVGYFWKCFNFLCWEWQACHLKSMHVILLHHTFLYLCHSTTPLLLISLLFYYTICQLNSTYFVSTPNKTRPSSPPPGTVSYAQSHIHTVPRTSLQHKKIIKKRKIMCDWGRTRTRNHSIWNRKR